MTPIPSQTLSLAEGFHRSSLTFTQLWVRYTFLGGNDTLAALRSHVAESGCADDHEHNLIAQALNDFFVEQGQDHPVAYTHRSNPPDGFLPPDDHR